MIIKLDFGEVVLEAELFDCVVANKFMKHLPCTIELTKWGDELYGSIGRDLGVDNPILEVPAGGLAYTNQGNYLCIFYGQTPAWPVEYIGQIKGDEWKKLVSLNNCDSLKISK